MCTTSSNSLPLFLFTSPFHAFRRTLSFACVQPSTEAQPRTGIDIFSFLLTWFYWYIYFYYQLILNNVAFYRIIFNSKSHTHIRFRYISKWFIEDRRFSSFVFCTWKTYREWLTRRAVITSRPLQVSPYSGGTFMPLHRLFMPQKEVLSLFIRF